MLFYWVLFFVLFMVLVHFVVVVVAVVAAGVISRICPILRRWKYSRTSGRKRSKE